MENYIRYYYNINPLDIHLENNNYFFYDVNYNRFCLYNLSKINIDDIELKKKYDLCNYLKTQGVYCHQIIINKMNNICILINNNKYILLKYKIDYGSNKKICLKDVLYFSQIPISTDHIYSNDVWKTRWSVKMDYFEYQLNQFGYKHHLLRESFGYYSGLVEMAIALHNAFSNNMDVMQSVLCHKRITYNDTLFDFYNPINLIIDNKVRDVSEYFKSKLINISNIAGVDKLIYEISIFLNYVNYNDNEYFLFFIRMLYSTAYFDKYEIIMNQDLKDDEVENILKKTPVYECFVKKLYIYLKKTKLVVNLPQIEWLSK
ncbi:MAG: hypothetical protein J6G98_01880 [Bacilli bacterium]|nr:hypothetical protein [Bacilli bacterium]